jgi:Ca2+:H+ antiporter
MHRTLRDTATLLRHHGLTRWSLLLLPALTLVLTAPLQPEGAGMEAVRFLGFGLALVPLARVISILVDELSEHLGDRYSGVVSVGLSIFTFFWRRPAQMVLIPSTSRQLVITAPATDTTTRP